MEGLVEKLMIGEDLGQVLLYFDESNTYIKPKQFPKKKQVHRSDSVSSHEDL